MQVRPGRLEKRIKLALPVWLSDLQKQDVAEMATTENVSTGGVRVLVRGPFLPQQSILLASTGGEMRAKTRVVYCQRLTEERFALGLQFEAGSLNWWSTLKEGSD